MTVPGLSASSAGGASPGQLVHGLDARGAVPGLPAGGVEPLPRRVQPRRHGLGGRLVVLDGLPQQQERVVEALLHDGGAVLAHLAAVAGALAGGQRAGGARGELGERVVEAVGAQLVAGAVRGAALDPVAPALHRAVHDRRSAGRSSSTRPAAAPRSPAGSRGRPGPRSRSSRAGRTAPSASTARSRRAGRPRGTRGSSRSRPGSSPRGRRGCRERRCRPRPAPPPPARG